MSQGEQTSPSPGDPHQISPRKLRHIALLKMAMIDSALGYLLSLGGGLWLIGVAWGSSWQGPVMIVPVILWFLFQAALGLSFLGLAITLYGPSGGIALSIPLLGFLVSPLFMESDLGGELLLILGLIALALVIAVNHKARVLLMRHGIRTGLFRTWRVEPQS